MSSPAVDLTDPKAVLHELLDNDQRVRDEFVAALGTELEQLAAGVAACFQRLPRINERLVQVNTIRTDLMGAFALGVLDDLMVSTKLLLGGKLPAGGNVMRQAIEGVAMALLCSTDTLLVIEQKENRPPVQARYWKKVWAGDNRVQGQHAIRQLGWNAAALGVRPEGIKSLRDAQQFFHPFSHCGQVAIVHRAVLEQPGIWNLGGHFEAAKLDGYRTHMAQRIGLCGVLPGFLDHLLATLLPVKLAATESAGRTNLSEPA
ncbi:hypothetical protein [Burkholderia stagnalis]|uniref:hypothetical protein n=1 Tax=Burkholderia stagnalis TaxID=1503054 RepID=UPI000F5BEC5A|nr:hypothetical protein [Burkholderia stagnalis]RQQ00408.1 hypothetical protein DF164_29660 [Burkholderia stagnalis]RQY63605.1 hypothetical protein DF110_33465 [Burkholderia stagnalis]